MKQQRPFTVYQNVYRRSYSTQSAFFEEKSLRIAVIAAGVVGKATGIGLEKKGHQVTFYDTDGAKLAQIASEGHRTASSIKEAVQQTDVSMICAPTPNANGAVDLGILLSICSEVGSALQQSDSYHLIVVRSTIPPGTTRQIVVPRIEATAGAPAGRLFGVCHNPEFLREKFASEDFLHPRAIVIGEMDDRAGSALQSIYSSFGSPVFRCDPETSEMTKYASNLFNVTKISFFNEIDRVCKTLGVRSEKIGKLMPLLALGLRDDLQEWGIYGGRAFGGMCLPKDLDAFIAFARKQGVHVPLLDAVRQVNQALSKEDQKVEVLVANG
jgi:nucleotide sugar dehydrogenase